MSDGSRNGLADKEKTAPLRTVVCHCHRHEALDAYRKERLYSSEIYDRDGVL